jgi:hypothetical protein
MAEENVPTENDAPVAIPAPGDGSSLLDKGTPPSEPEVAPSPDAPKRPDYISEQHWDAEKGEPRLEALAKSFTDTKSALDKRRDESGVPINAGLYVSVKEDGTIQVPDGLEFLPPIMSNDPTLVGFLEVAHEHEIPQKTVNALLESYMTATDKVYSEYTFDADKVMAEIDPDPVRAGHLVSGVNAYIGQLGLDEPQLGAVESLMQSAAGVHTIAKFMKAAGHLPIAMGASHAPTTDTTAMKTRWDEIRNNPQLMDSSPAVRAEFEGIGRKLFG